MPPDRPAESAWTVIVPVKRFDTAKARLSPELAAPARADFALAFARDTIRALLLAPAVRRLIIVSDRPPAGLPVPEGASVLVQRGTGLNPALREARLVAHAAAPGDPILIAVADLPCLRADHVDAALAAAGHRRPRLVVDAAGTGTTAITLPPAAELSPSFGPDSAARHRRAGFRELRLPRDHTLRRDVDTREDLRLAEGLGVGEHTRAALRRWADRAEPSPAASPLS